MFTVPEPFARDTIAREGEAGRQWLAALPGLVEQLCRQWQLTLDGATMHGYLGVVVPVQRNGEPCVLKVSWQDGATTHEAVALAAWNGQGTVRLLAAESTVGAMLLERLDHQRTLRTVAVDEALVVAGRLLRRLAIPATVALPTSATLAAEMMQQMPVRWERYGQPFPRRLLDHACALALHHGATATHLLVNYDLHDENILAGRREPWLAVDPKVVIGEPALGIAQLLWNRLDQIETSGGLDRHFARLVEAAELDEALARDWTLVRCIDYWLWGLSVGLTEDPKRCAAIVAWLN